MSTQTIIESGMTFGPFPENRCYYIEKSNCYAAIQEHVQIAEFLLLRINNEKPVTLDRRGQIQYATSQKPNLTSMASSLRSGKNSLMPYRLDGHLA